MGRVVKVGTVRRRCTKCGETKELNADNFHYHCTGKLGYTSVCSLCANRERRSRRERYGDGLSSYAKETKRKSIRDSIRRVRLEVINVYGGICKCCGESRTEFLSLDHVNNDGARHRRETGTNSGSAAYYWARRNGYPDILQLLCHNCNTAKGYYERCPHEAERERKRTRSLSRHRDKTPSDALTPML